MPIKISQILNRVKYLLQRNNPGFFSFCCRRQRFFKFWLVGLLAGAIDLILIFVFHRLLSLAIVPAATLAFIASFLLTFGCHRRFTFGGARLGHHQFFLYGLNIFICLNLNALLMHFLVNRLGIWYLLSQFLANVLLGLYNFLMYRLVIFRSYGSVCLKR